MKEKNIKSILEKKEKEKENQSKIINEINENNNVNKIKSINNNTKLDNILKKFNFVIIKDKPLLSFLLIFFILLILIILILNFIFKKKKIKKKINIKKIKNKIDISNKFINQVNDSKSKDISYFKKYEIGENFNKFNNLKLYYNQNDNRIFVQGENGKLYRNLSN